MLYYVMWLILWANNISRNYDLMTLYYKENKQIGLDNYNKIISIHYISIINDYKVMYTNNFIYRSKIFMRYIIYIFIPNKYEKYYKSA
jgi:hypothetical protein